VIFVVGPFPIVTGDPTFIVDGQPLARHGAYLACGCQVLPVRQSTVSVDSGGSGGARSGSAAASTVMASPAGFVAKGTTAQATTASPPLKQVVVSICWPP